jgi:hypothetical protein
MVVGDTTRRMNLTPLNDKPKNVKDDKFYAMDILLQLKLFLKKGRKYQKCIAHCTR